MRNINTIKSEINQLRLQIQNLRKKAEVDFKLDLNDLLDKHAGKFDRLDIGINNHEFNDGDATYFSVHYEDMSLVYSDELGNESEQSSYGDTDNAEMEAIREEFVELFKVYDIDDLYENLYGGEYGSLSITGKRKA